MARGYVDKAEKGPPPSRSRALRRRCTALLTGIAALGCLFAAFHAGRHLGGRSSGGGGGGGGGDSQDALLALEQWLETEGEAAGLDPAALESLSVALATKRRGDSNDSSGSGAGGSGRDGGDAWQRGRPALEPPPEIAARCKGTVGDWCGRYLLQERIPTKPPPQGDKRCPNDCNGVGVCQADFGHCLCPAGWDGEGCQERFWRPCTKQMRVLWDDPVTNGSHPFSEPGWTASRCPGVCDDEIAACYCNGTYGRINAPLDAPPGTPPIQEGRPMVLHIRPRLDENGDKTEWAGGSVPNEDIWGPDGWCEAEKPNLWFDCMVDGRAGQGCSIVHEMTCVNQCNGRGECQKGFCACLEGWYGHDCAQRRPDAPEDRGLELTRPHIKKHVATFPARDPKRRKQRRRPLIYVYDLPPEFNGRMIQYRNDATYGFWRKFGSKNESEVLKSLYMVETAMHEMMLQSEHRTLDPEEADFFYVPVYVNVFVWPVYGWADAPWYHGPWGPRVMHAAHLLQKAQQWIEQEHPRYWHRRGGRDHIWTNVNDEGGCWMPNSLWQGIVFGHWGRTDAEHESSTGYDSDDYSKAHINDKTGRDWREVYSSPAQHPCYDPVKDLLLPTIHVPAEFAGSPLQGVPPRPRTILGFFRGETGNHRAPRFSRGIRQRLKAAADEGNWRENHNIRVDNHDEDASVPYTDLLATSVFCFVMPGDGWARRGEDAILHGCIPVIIMDGVEEKFSTIVDYSAFSLRIPESDTEQAADILAAVPEERRQEMQEAIGRIWHRFVWALPMVREDLEARQATNLAKEQHADPEASYGSAPHPFTGAYTQDDALSTIFQWLYARIDEVHAGSS